MCIFILIDFDAYSLLLFLFHKHCWFIDYDSLFDVYSFDILSISYVLWIQAQFLYFGFIL